MVDKDEAGTDPGSAEAGVVSRNPYARSLTSFLPQ